jgi:hypothetical protein
MTDLQGRCGDFPGVCSRQQQQAYALICPDPNLILKSRVLGY